MFGFKLNIVLISLCFYTIVLFQQSNSQLRSLSSHERFQYKEKVRSMFYHAYDGYIKYASNFDELMPITCSGMNTWGTFSLSLIDALDTLAILNNYTEFRRVAEHIIEIADFETNTNVSVFETNIRVVGGLLSAHLLSYRAGLPLEEGWPCNGPLLRLAENVARRLLPAFDTATGMPYGTVNFIHGVPENETPVTCTAGVGTFIVEFGTLSRLTGDPIFEQKALKALDALQKYRSKIGLLGNHINVQDGKWVATEAGIGAGVDSYFEYLVKGSQLLQMPSLMEVFHYDYDLIKNYIQKNDWYVWVSMISGSATMPIFQSLEAFFPGLLTLLGDIDQAKKSLYNYHQVWKQYGFVPEFYDIVNSKHHKREGYPLRPEFIESVVYLYQATKDPHLLTIGADVVDSIYHSAQTECGYATIKSVSDHTLEDRMESFFLAETLKYLYLLFDEDNFIHNKGDHGFIVNDPALRSHDKSCVIESGGYVFNTEAHPIDISALSCCSSYHEQKDFEQDMNLFDLLSFKKYSKTHVPNIGDNENKTENLDEYLNVEDVLSTKPLELKFPSSDYKDEHYGSLSTHQTSQCTNEYCENITLSYTSQIQPSFSENSHWTNSEVAQTNSDDHTIEIHSSNEPSLHSNFHHNSIDHVSTTDEILEHSIYEKDQSSNNEFVVPLSAINEKTSVDGDASATVVSSVHESSPTQTTPIDDKQKLNSYYEELEKMLQLIQQTKEKSSLKSEYESLSCPSQPFLMRLSLYGQMF